MTTAHATGVEIEKIIRELNGRLEEYVKRIEYLREQNEKLNSELVSVRDKEAYGEYEKKKLEEQVNELSLRLERYTFDKDQVTKLYQEMTSLKVEVSMLRRLKHAMEQERKQDKERIADLNDKLRQLNLSLTVERTKRLEDTRKMEEQEVLDGLLLEIGHYKNILEHAVRTDDSGLLEIDYNPENANSEETDPDQHERKSLGAVLLAIERHRNMFDKDELSFHQIQDSGNSTQPKRVPPKTGILKTSQLHK